MPAWFDRFDSKSPRDVALLFVTRSLRMFAYGLLSVVLVLFLAEAGLSKWQVGLVLSFTLAGDIGVSLLVTTHADRLGRKKLLVASSLLMAAAGAVFALTGNFWVLLAAATVGIIAPSDKEVGPFLSLEQASLAEVVPAGRRTSVFAWYHLAGSLAAALGSFCGGAALQWSETHDLAGVTAYRPVLLLYATVGLLLTLLFAQVSSAIEPDRAPPAPDRPAAAARFLGLHGSRRVVWLLALLFSLDAFGGGFILQSLLAYWLHLRFHVEPAELGRIFLVTNLLAGVSALSAGWLAERIGLVNTMVFTHLPSNILLLLIPLTTDVHWAVGLLLLRFSISQMDVPTRQALTMHLVAPDERSAAAGITAVARSVGAAVSPLLAAGFLGSIALVNLPLVLAGAIKIAYDVLIFAAMRREEKRPEG